MTGKSNAGQDEIVERKRRRTAEDGRLLTNVPTSLGLWVCAEAEELGISPATMTRMLIVEAIKARGLTLKDIEEKYPTPALEPDKRVKPRTITGEQPVALAV